MALSNALHRRLGRAQDRVEKRRVSLNYYQQATELPDLKAACPEYAEVNAQVVHDALRRLERAFQAFFRRIRNGKRRAPHASRGRAATIALPTRNMTAARC